MAPGFLEAPNVWIFEATWVVLTWVYDLPFYQKVTKTGVADPTLGKLAWVCHTHVKVNG